MGDGVYDAPLTATTTIVPAVLKVGRLIEPSDRKESSSRRAKLSCCERFFRIKTLFYEGPPEREAP